MTATTGERRSPIDKHDARRRALADSALRTLGERGYAKTSLREMANNSEFSHGVVHYYFADKLDLIVYCVQHYKTTCITRYDDIVADSASGPNLLDAFSAKLRETIVDDAPMHRLWYDLRSQSMFERGLGAAVTQIDGTLADMIWRVVTRYADLVEATVRVEKPDAYGALDGLFQQALLGHQREPDGDHLDRLDRQVHLLLPMLVEPAAAS